MELSNAFWVLLGCMLSGMLTAITGIPLYLRRQSLAGDALAHAMLPGVCIGIWLSGYRDHWSVYLAGTASGLLSLALLNFIRRKSKIPEDGATGISLVLFFALGLALLSSMQRSPLGNAGVSYLILGNAAAMLPSEIFTLIALFAVCLFLGWWFFRPLWLFCFDAGFARSSGMKTLQTEWLLNLWLALVVTASIRSIGMVLTAALLITPAALGHFASFKPIRMVGIATITAGLSGILAAWWSTLTPGISTGAAMVVLLSMMALLMLMVWPQKGYLSRWQIKSKERKRWLMENALKELWKFEKLPDEEIGLACGLSVRATRQLKRAMFKKKWLVPSGQGVWALNATGKTRAETVVRRHRLWESYLHHRLHLPADHLHENAEIVEHLLTDELEERIIEVLSHPSLDPHASKIPYPSND